MANWLYTLNDRWSLTKTESIMPKRKKFIAEKTVALFYCLQHKKAEVLHTCFLPGWALQQVLVLFHINLCQQTQDAGSHFVTPFYS